MKREFLMLAQTYKEQDISRWLISEKLDGMRCFWDGGVSRGQPKSTVPWANTAKDARYKDEQIATGLWSRYGHVIHAPDYFLDQLPPMLLDGELYTKRGEQQILMSIVKAIVPGPGWKTVRFFIFDSPPLERVFESGQIDSLKRGISQFDAAKMYVGSKLLYRATTSSMFGDVYGKLYNLKIGNNVVSLLEQITNPNNISARLDEITDEGGEGLIARNPDSIWTPERSHSILKIKKFLDDEGIVTGYISGKGKLKGLMGALVLDYKGLRLELSGFTDAERALVPFAAGLDGSEQPQEVASLLFPRGSKVTFRYRELSLTGVPKEARYWRKK